MGPQRLDTQHRAGTIVELDHLSEDTDVRTLTWYWTEEDEVTHRQGKSCLSSCVAEFIQNL